MALFTAQLGQKALAIELDLGRYYYTRGSTEGGQEVAEVDEVLGNLTRVNGSRPAGNHRYMGAGVSHRALAAQDLLAAQL